LRVRGRTDAHLGPDRDPGADRDGGPHDGTQQSSVGCTQQRRINGTKRTGIERRAGRGRRQSRTRNDHGRHANLGPTIPVFNAPGISLFPGLPNLPDTRMAVPPRPRPPWSR
jgi:hypothetical protein